MNPPRRWPLEPRRRQAPRPRPGRFAGRRSPHDPHHHQPPVHGGDLRARHGARPPLARRWRRARLPPALGLVGPRRSHRHSSHHGPRLAACHVVDHRDEGIATFSTAPRPFRPGRGELQKSGRGGGRARCRRRTAGTPRRRLRLCSGGGVEGIAIPRDAFFHCPHK